MHPPFHTPPQKSVQVPRRSLTRILAPNSPTSVSKCGPPDPAFRANPFPEVTDLFCRLPLSTLFYRPEAANLGDLMRLLVRPGVRIDSHSDFHGSSRTHLTLLMVRCSAWHEALSLDNPIPGRQSVKKKRELFQGCGPTSPSSLVLPHNIHVQFAEY